MDISAQASVIAVSLAALVVQNLFPSARAQIAEGCTVVNPCWITNRPSEPLSVTASRENPVEVLASPRDPIYIATAPGESISVTTIPNR
jgi:hypothetical protein